jgi:HIRAN domain
MDQIRRNLLLGAGGALAGAVVAAPVALAGANGEVALLSTYVAGTAYHAAPAAAPALRPGAPLALQREHGNDYDPRAIVVRTWSGAKLGYVPRVDNHALARLMDAGFAVTARVREVRPDARQPDIRLDVFLAV